MNKVNKNAVKYIVCSILGVLIILYFVYQIIQMNSSPYKTEVAFQKNVQTTVNTTAFVVRDEAYITASDATGTVVSIAEDGKRVGSGDPVAVVFSSAESAAAYVRINELEDEISYYKQLKNRVGIGTNAPSSYSNMIDDACLDFISASREGIDSNFNEALKDLRDAVTARQLAVGEQLSVDSKLTALESELLSLQGKASGYSTVASPNSGYYIGSVDGYENAISYDDVLNVNCEKINSLLSYQKQTPASTTMGKLVDEFNWYLLCNVPYGSSGDIAIGDVVSVNIPNTAVGKIKCTVAFKGNKEGEQVAVVLKCNTMNRDVANLRIEDIEIILNEYNGIRINNSAIREQDGEKGVFVVRGNIVQFKKINIIESNEEYSIIEASQDSSFVREYDTIITQGVDLYDGKVIS